MFIVELSDKLGFYSFKGRNWYIQVICVFKGKGFYEGLEWFF